MTLRVLLFLCLTSLAFVGVIAFAAWGAPVMAIASGCSLPLFLLIASRESDAAREEARWADARRHPRL